MQLDRRGVLAEQESGTVSPARMRKQSGGRLRAVAAILLTASSCMPGGFAQSPAGTTGPDKAASDLPVAPAPQASEPFSLRTTQRDFSRPFVGWRGNPIRRFTPTSIEKASFVNSVRLNDMVRDGKIYLSLSDALALALENNYDIAIARYDLDIADTDILRAKTGATLLGVSTGIVSNTLGGASSTSSTGGGPGGTTVGSGGAGSGSSGLTLTTAGAGPAPESLDPVATAAISFDRDHAPSTSFYTGGTSSTNQYNFTLNQGFVTGTNLAVAFNNEYASSSNAVNLFSPELSSTFKVTVTQHLLQGAGIWVNKRFIYTAQNNRRITDSSFRQQILYTVNQVESIYWGLVQAYEDVQSKERALAQSGKLLDDDKKQLEIGTMAPLDVVNAESTVASDKQALISAQSSLNYQQQIIKQAIARNLNDQALSTAPVIPTDRVSLEPIPEENQPLEDLVQTAFQQRPELEQAILTLRNDEITLKGARNALLPTFDVNAYYQGQGVAGKINPYCASSGYYTASECAQASSGYGSDFKGTFNDSAPDKGIGFNISIPLRNREAQSVQARSLMEYRQAELRLEQLYTQIRMQVVNARFALSNDRAQVESAQAARDYDQQSLDAEIKKLHLGASTTANVLMQQRNLATAEANLIAAHASYAKDRAGLYQLLATTLKHYGINMEDAATAQVKAAPLVPGVQAVKAEAPAAK
ncbi:TolC family protein [Telmatobacter bradus]|uniref:TolC family protein n=1 Tax=Telmatobacter bradus TaxID=474953 RepID=UPI003B43345E